MPLDRHVPILYPLSSILFACNCTAFSAMLIITPAIQIPDSEFGFTFARSSGPGGQNVNKVNSKAVLRWSPTTSPSLPEDVRSRFLLRFASRLTIAGELILTSQRSRDQNRNIEDCLERLKEMLLAVTRKPVQRRPTKPTRGSHKRRLEAKRLHSSKKRRRRGPPRDE
jgi:ribosome-associated protein